VPNDPDSETVVPEEAGSNPSVVLYLKPRTVAFTPPVAVMLPFRVADVLAIDDGAAVVMVGGETHEEEV
jgi:hypothetical protein